MTNHRLYALDASDDQIAIVALAQILGVSDEAAARIFAEEADTPIEELTEGVPMVSPGRRSFHGLTEIPR